MLKQKYQASHALRFVGHKRATKYLRVVYVFYTRGEFITLTSEFPFGLPTPNLHILYFPAGKFPCDYWLLFCTNPCKVPANPSGFYWPVSHALSVIGWKLWPTLWLV